MFASLHHRWHTFQRHFALQPRHHRITEIVVGLLLLLWLTSFVLITRPHDQYGHTNVLLLGVGDKDHDAADLTDSMMIASIDPSTHSLVLLSIPRDLYLSENDILPDERINLLYANEKARIRKSTTITEKQVSLQALKNVAQELGNKLGVEIHGVIKGDFTAFTKAVDRIGGLDIDVPALIIDNAYPLTEHTTGLFKIAAGRRHLDGATALKYARTRHSGTDFDRSARQQQILEALSQKVRRMSRLHQFVFAVSLLSGAAEHVESTFSMPELLGLARLGSTLSRDRVQTVQINFDLLVSGDPALYKGASVLLPASYPDDVSGWEHLRAFVQDALRHRMSF